MATRLLSFLLIFLGAILSAALNAQTQNDSDPLGDIVAPDLERREIGDARIDTENWEVGAFAGVMSIEDFGANSVYGARAAYHITENFFTELSIGLTTAGESSLELFDGTILQLTDEQRDLTYYNAVIGYNLFQGEIFFGSKRAFNTNFYVVAGAGNTEFADNDYFSYTLGVGTRLFFTDWFTLHGDVRAHSFSHELFGVEKSIINLEPNLGMTIFF